MSDGSGRFLSLAQSYYRAAVITDELFRNRIFETKIKMKFAPGDEVSNRKYNAIVSMIAQRERYFDARSHTIEPEYRDIVADAYFADLNYHGEEWEFADLEPRFRKWKELALQQLELERENY